MNEKMKKYTYPQLQFVHLNNHDILTTSTIEVSSKSYDEETMSDLAPTRSWEGDF